MVKTTLHCGIQYLCAVYSAILTSAADQICTIHTVPHILYTVCVCVCVDYGTMSPPSGQTLKCETQSKVGKNS